MIKIVKTSSLLFSSLLFSVALTLMAAHAYADEIDSNIQYGLISEQAEPSKQALVDGVEKQATILLDIEVAIDGLIKGKPIALPLFDKDYLISIDKTYAGAEGVVTYAGNVYLENQKEPVGDILLTHGGGLVYGLISTEGGVFQIIPNSEEKATDYSLQKMKQTAAVGFTDFPEPKELLESLDKHAQTEELAQTTSIGKAASCCNVDVLVFFTPHVRASHGGPIATANWISTIIASYNQKLAEVGLGNYSFTLKAALQTVWPAIPAGYHENITHNSVDACTGPGTTGNCDSIVADQRWLIFNSAVANLRNQYAADLVALITSNNRKHPQDFAHGFAGLKEHHGTGCGNRIGIDCGQFITVRDAFALSNLTFHHEAGHALGMGHLDGVRTFGVNFNNPNGQSPNPILKPPLTIMQVNSLASPICLWTTNGASSSCNVRLPFYADKYQYRTMYYSWFADPRKFDPFHHVEDDIVRGFNWLANRK